MNLSENTILVTGGTSGIGYEMAKEFLKRDNKVIITGRNEQKLQKAVQELKGAIGIACDVSQPDQIQQLYQQIEKEHPDLNILINNAGVMLTINLQAHKLSERDLTQEFDINVKGTIWMNDAFLPLLGKNSHSATVTVSSGLAFAPLPITPIYCATKAALHSYSLSLREQLKNTSIKVFELAPPATKTELLAGFEEEDMEGVTPMTVEALVAKFIEGLSKDKLEICPGQASQLKFMGRFFPNFILKQLSKPIARMHAEM
ncbi:SDR family oxidoreductase [Reichenbachiella ulvae]|uniref:SDR family NAD(P)-dependent oxidoreductase n=1 Tax=Reichenbachiella ulvae TaxID=2980104 RepID=A0ABT3CTR3_9BACT|nr:SDR family NAD(P)-dependent oxidoreductase [Reichenbachiella ulvae]MCV9386865.1 SDR family NAD(P)-dependent oxidoreductase [Reichenbachiella ulvae]